VFVGLFDLVGILLSHPADLGGCVRAKALLEPFADSRRIRRIARDLPLAASQNKQR
jgi:hypothetical protein